MDTTFDYAEELGLLRRAVAEPVPQLIVVEFDTKARLETALAELIALNPARAHVIQTFDFEKDTAAGLLHSVREKLRAAIGTPPPLLILHGPDRIELTEGAPASQRFWKEMNQARESWGALGAQILLCVERWTYRQIIAHADHLLSWAGMKIHLFGSTELLAVTDRTALSEWLFWDHRLSPEIAKEHWGELGQGLQQALERGEPGAGFLQRFYIPMLEAALSSGDLNLARQTRDAAQAHGQFQEEDLPRWHELNLVLALAGHEPDLANEHAHKLLDLAKNHHDERVRQRALTAVNNQAQLLVKTAEYSLAEPLYRTAVELAQKNYGLEHPMVAAYLNNLAQLLQTTNRLAEAEPLMRRAVAISDKTYGPENGVFAIHLNNLAQLLVATNRLPEAEPLLRQALIISQKNEGQNHPNVARQLNNLAILLMRTNRLGEAEPLLRQALAIDEKFLGQNHPNVAADLNNLAQLLKAKLRLAEAELFMRRALDIDESYFGVEHPLVATRLNNLAQLFQANNRLAEAEPLLRRALDIDEKSFGLEHPDVAVDLNNLAQLFVASRRLAESEPMMRKSFLILLKFSLQTGYPHIHLQMVEKNYRFILEKLTFTPAQISQRLSDLGKEAGFDEPSFQKLLAQLAPDHSKPA